MLGLAGKGYVAVGVKDDTASEGVVRWAAQEAAARGLALVAAHSYTMPSTEQAMPAEGIGIAESAARQVVTEALGRVTMPAQLPVYPLVLAQPPHTLLEDLSKEAALVVVGRDDLTTFRRLMHGATSAAVCRRAECPVVVVPPVLRPVAGRQPVIVAADGLTPSAPVLQAGFDAAAARSLPLQVLHVGQESDTPTDLADRRRNIEEILAGWRADRPDVSVDVDVVRGHPAASICSHATHAALIVIGRAHQRRFRSWSQSVANAVLDHCRCPLVICPESPYVSVSASADDVQGAEPRSEWVEFVPLP